MKKLIIFNPSIEGGGVERNIKLIFKTLEKPLKKKIYFVSCDKIDKIDNSIEIIKPIIKLNIKSRVIKYLICILSVLKIYFENKDLVIFSFQANVYAIIISKILRIPIIVRANSAPHKWTNNLKILIIKTFYKMADLVIVNSFEFKKEIKSVFKVKSKVIYNLLDTKNLYLLSKQSKKFSFFENDKKSLKIINVGRLTYQKNQIELLKIIKSVKKDIPIKLLIIGNGPEKENLNQYINQNKLAKIVKILPYMKNPYVYFKKSEIFILTSLYEGLPNALIEATFFKLLCISYKCKTGPKEILRNGMGGLLVNEHNIKKISSILKKYYHSKNKNSYRKMIKFSYKNTRRYDLNNQRKIYQKLLIKYLR